MSRVTWGNTSWSLSCDEAQLILKDLREGVLNPNTCTPTIVVDIHPDFAKFKKNSFSSGVRKLCNIVKNENQKADSKRYSDLAGEQ